MVDCSWAPSFCCALSPDDSGTRYSARAPSSDTPRLSQSQEGGRSACLATQGNSTTQARGPYSPTCQLGQPGCKSGRPKAAGDSGCPREFRERRAAIPELILEVGPEAKCRGWKELPESSASSLSQLWGEICAHLCKHRYGWKVPAFNTPRARRMCGVGVGSVCPSFWLGVGGTTV